MYDIQPANGWGLFLLPQGPYWWLFKNTGKKLAWHPTNTEMSVNSTIFLLRIVASASPVEGAIPGAGSSPLLNYVCFDVFIFFYL